MWNCTRRVVHFGNTNCFQLGLIHWSFTYCNKIYLLVRRPSDNSWKVLRVTRVTFSHLQLIFRIEVVWSCRSCLGNLWKSWNSSDLRETRIFAFWPIFPWANNGAGNVSRLSHNAQWITSYLYNLFVRSKDLDPCLDVHCASFGVCKTYSAHEARCVCNENCPSYQDPVCTANGTTYDNKCLYELSYCKGLDNNTMYHPGSCEGRSSNTKRHSVFNEMFSIAFKNMYFKTTKIK